MLKSLSTDLSILKADLYRTDKLWVLAQDLYFGCTFASPEGEKEMEPLVVIKENDSMHQIVLENVMKTYTIG